MSRLVVVAACTAVLLAAGCSGSKSHHSDDKSPRPERGNETSHAEASNEPAATGTMTFRYDAAETPEAQRGRQMMVDSKLLESVAGHVNDTLNLPHDVGAVGKQCGDANDYWDPNVNEIQLCYEDIEQSEQRFGKAGNPDPVRAAVNMLISGFYHELGHATLGIYQLAFTGREEDVADQLSAFMLLNPGADGKPYPDGVRIATNTATEWKLSAKEAGDANELPFWDGHSMDITRMYNWECWIYGSNPQANASIVASGDLPESRAGNCQEEFENMQRGWQSLLGPHLRKPS